MTAYEKFCKSGRNSMYTDFYNVEPGINTLRFRLYDEDYEEDYKKVKVNVESVCNDGDYTVISLGENGRWYYNKMEKAFKAEDQKAMKVAETGKFE